MYESNYGEPEYGMNPVNTGKPIWHCDAQEVDCRDIATYTDGNGHHYCQTHKR